MSKQKKPGLGRGISALIPQTTDSQGNSVTDVFFSGGEPSGMVGGSSKQNLLSPVPGAKLARIKLSQLVPNAVQPRKDFEEEALSELEHSVKEFGVLQPIVVREIKQENSDNDKEPKYEIIMGERRYRASKRAGLEDIPAVIRHTNDENMLRDALLENLHRANLNPLEEASAYQQLLSDFGITQEQLAQKIGRSRPQITNTIRLLQLPETVQTYIAAGKISSGHGRAILSVSEKPEDKVLFAEKIIKQELTVRAAEKAAKEIFESNPDSKNHKPIKLQMPQLERISEKLSKQLDTNVNISMGKSKGKIVLEFTTYQDLVRILKELGIEK